MTTDATKSYPAMGGRGRVPGYLQPAAINKEAVYQQKKATSDAEDRKIRIQKAVGCVVLALALTALALTFAKATGLQHAPKFGLGEATALHIETSLIALGGLTLYKAHKKATEKLNQNNKELVEQTFGKPQRDNLSPIIDYSGYSLDNALFPPMK